MHTHLHNGGIPDTTQNIPSPNKHHTYTYPYTECICTESSSETEHTAPQIRNQRIPQKNHQERHNSKLLYNPPSCDNRRNTITIFSNKTKPQHSTTPKITAQCKQTRKKALEDINKYILETRNKQIPPHVHTLLPHHHKKTSGQANKILLQILLWTICRTGYTGQYKLQTNGAKQSMEH